MGTSFTNNYNQGICIEEGSSAKIIDNTITKNMKANIAYGGEGSQHTKIERNEISGSAAEGIFIVEGRHETSIFENIIKDNLDGISMYKSRGKVIQNLVEGNQRWGIHCAGGSWPELSKNMIKSNVSIGLMMKDGSQPKNILSNVIINNHFQISVDKGVKKKLSENVP